MTRISDSVRFCVVEGDSPTDAATLATEIYDRFIAAPEDDPDRENAPTVAAMPESPEPEDATLPDSVAPVEEAQAEPQAPQRMPQLPTFPPLPRDRTPDTPTVSSVAPKATASVPSSPALTDKETALLREVLGDKFTDAQVQRLIAVMREEGVPEENAPRSPATPLSPRTVNRYRLAALVLVLVVLGIGTSIFLNRATGKGLMLPNAPTGATPPATPSATPTPIPQLDATVTSRNVALDAALKESEGQRNAIDLARRDYLLSLADTEMKKNGTPVETWLIRRLNTQMLELRRALGQGGQFSGNAQQIGTARALVGDARAILLALQQEWQHPNAAPGRNRIAPAVLAKQMSELAELARLVREASYEQQLRDQEQAQERERAAQRGEKPVVKGKSGGSGNVLPATP